MKEDCELLRPSPALMMTCFASEHVQDRDQSLSLEWQAT